MNWLTHFELSDGMETPPYADTIHFLEEMTANHRLVKIRTFGKTAQGRDMKYIVLGRQHTPAQARKRNKAIVFIQNAIHGGEMEGKDAWLLLIRSMIVTKELQHLLKHLVLVVIPVFNIDGHDRRGHWNRPNQIGPVEQGWRTTAQNFDLNRDHMKADTPEMKALLQLYHSWLPDFCIDNHCTDGADFQYRILYGLETHQNLHPDLLEWSQKEFLPGFLQGLKEKGIDTVPYNEGNDLNAGIVNSPANPRLSTGYSAIQNRICLLVEAHSLKPYADRVYSTRDMNQSVLEYLNDHHEALLDRNRFADENTILEYSQNKKPFPISVTLKAEAETVQFKGFRSYEEESPISGNAVIHYTKEPEEFELPLYSQGEIAQTVIVPEGYYVPPEYAHIANHLRLHGVVIDRLQSSCALQAERYRFRDVSFAPAPYESRFRVNFGLETQREKVTLATTGFIVRTAQRSLRVILHLLEPEGPDSLVRWGFFPTIFERKEYIEPYMMEPIARTMLEENIALREEFNNLLEKDEAFREDPGKRLDFFYQRSIYFDRNEKLYPIARLLELPHV